jgi:hypothetical protein
MGSGGLFDGNGIPTGQQSLGNMLSTMDRKAGAMVWVAHPLGPRLEFGDCSLTPNQVSSLMRFQTQSGQNRSGLFWQR